MLAKLSSSFCLIILLGVSSLALSQSPIILDEDITDWNASHATYVDGADNPGGIDLLDMQVANDEEYLYVKFSVDRELALGNTLVAHTIWLAIDADNNPATGFQEQTGYGTELAINFNGHYAWFNIPSPAVQVDFGEIGLHAAPTVTATTFEVAIPRDVKPDGVNSLFSGDTIRLVINEDRGNDRMPDDGTIFTYVFDNSPADSVSYLELAKDDPSHIRAVSYNVLFDNAWTGGGLTRLERIVKALDGDLFCFQESNQTSAQVAKGHFDTWLPLNHAGGWYAHKDGGRLTLSKWPIADTWNLERKSAMLIDLPNTYARDFLLINGHLSCCTNNQGRQDQVDEFASFVLDAKTPGGSIDLPIYTPIVFLGDMNFVGFGQQLETAITGNIQNELRFGLGGPLDWDRSDLTDARPLHIDSNLVFTWRDLQGDGFPPGRLDFHFYTDAALDLQKAFVLQTESMPADLLLRYSLQSVDTEVSDHLPVVVDYAINQALTSVKQEDKDLGIHIYPNPAKDFITIDATETIEWIVLRDLLGRKVLLSGLGTHKLDLTQLQAGTYLMEIKFKGLNETYTRKISLHLP